MVELKARPPVWRPQQSLQGAGKIDKHVAHQEEPEEKRTEEETERKSLKRNKTLRRLLTTTVCVFGDEGAVLYVHGEDGCDWIQGGDDDADLTDASCEEEGPGGLPVGFTMPKHLQQHDRIKSNESL